jgi:hypothetical protein
MLNTLITAYEVKRYSPAGRSYPEANICLLARQVEEDFMQKCLGKEMYDWLKSKLTPYPSDAREYDASISYDLNEVVIRHGCLFKSLTNCNRTDPAEFDNDWEVLRKFTDSCANSLWERYLREALAFRVYEAAIVYDTIHSTAGGLVVSVSDAMSATTRAATKVEIAEVTTRLRQHQEVIIDNMRRWLRYLRESNQCAQMPLSQSLACAGSDCEGAKPNARRIAFRY